MQAQKATQLFKTILSRQVVLKNGKRFHGHTPIATYNDLPKPQGSWQTNHDAQQRKYNAQLAFGVAFTVGTIIFARATGCLFLNYDFPKQPADNITYD